MMTTATKTETETDGDEGADEEEAPPAPFKIDKGVPLLGAGGGGSEFPGAARMPFESMKVGDSFLMEGTKGIKDQPYRSMSARIRKNARERMPEASFAIRRLPEGLRIWRINSVRRPRKPAAP